MAVFNKVLIANRGEIAVRIIRACREQGVATVAVYSDLDRDALHTRLADEAYALGGQTAAESYLDVEAIMGVIERSGADAVHPGYGFFSENADFARAVTARGVTFIGPPPEAIEVMGDKISARLAAEAVGVLGVPGTTEFITDPDQVRAFGAEHGYPIAIKAAYGGGGRGMKVVADEAAIEAAIESAQREALAYFARDEIYMERYLTAPRHIEVQVLADSHGNAVYLGERECSIQRRNQKVIEEAPSPFLDPETRAAMGEQAVRLAQAVGYTSAGTVEFIVDGERNFYFLEMNTRLQVEHPVTELITGVDLVEQMIRIAAGAPLELRQQDVKLNGWAIESRLYAEDPYRGFLPSIGRLTRYRPPAEGRSAEVVTRNDTGVYEGGEISMYYDPMIAKLCTWAPDRAGALAAMRDALDGFELEGIGHNLPFLSAVMDHPKFVSGDMTTAFIAEEYPNGFNGVTLEDAKLRQVAAAAAAMFRVAEIRRSRISGRMDNHERKVGSDWVVALGGTTHAVQISADRDGADVRFEDGSVLRVVSDWVPGQSLARLRVDDAGLVMKVDKITSGFRLRLRGADLKVNVWTPRQAELAALMPDKQPPDTSKLLLCPMPGMIVKIDVEPGQEVQDGQALCTVEAMKMENILRAERRGVVAKVNAAAGDSLAVDDVILEFE